MAGDNYVLVPRVPTPEMFRAAEGAGVSFATQQKCWAAMLAAAPSPPAAAPGGGDAEEMDEALDDLLARLADWGKAYPLDMFPEPDDADLKWLHETKRGLCDRIAASMGRHMARMIEGDIAQLRATTARRQAEGGAHG